MTKILYLGTYGADDPTRASMPFHMALGAAEAGHSAEINLAGDGFLLYSRQDHREHQRSGYASLERTL